MRIQGGRVLTREGLRPMDLTLEGARIAPDHAPGGGESLDASGCLVLPGFLDIHTHGAAGVDVNAADEAGFRTIAAFKATQGVTGWLCSILTDTREQTLRAIGEAVKVIRAPGGGAALLGIHLEGPCLAPEYKGAMPEHLLMKRADLELFAAYQKAAEGCIKYVTLSPEVEGAAQIIPGLKKLGITVAIGHSGATYDQARTCLEAGAAAGTHMGNAMRLFHQHEPAIFGALLESDAYCEAICDGLHLHPATVRMYLKCKGWDRVVAITDAIMAAGLPDGDYKLGVNDVVVKNGDAKLHDGTRAGSTLTLARALRNLTVFTGHPAEECCRLMTANPAALMGWATKGAIAPGMDADLVILDRDLNVKHTIVAGELVYSA